MTGKGERRRMTFGSLFSGIGGMDLGLERAGMECRWQVEIDPFCQRVLEKHWPHVKRYGDIKTVDGADLERVDLIAGGFPCQDVSRAGLRAGIDGRRSGLWGEMFRLVCELRPRFVLVENVTGLLDGGVGRVLGDLAGVGFDAEWSVLSACSMGAAHMRRRVFVLAHPHRQHGWPWIWDSTSRQTWSIQARSSFESSRTRTRARLANPSKLYRGINGLPAGLDENYLRNRAIGNGVYPPVAEWIGRRIIGAFHEQAV